MHKMLLNVTAACAALLATPAIAAPVLSEDFSNGFGAFQVSGQVQIARGSVEYAACCSATGSAENLANPFASFGSSNVSSGFITTQVPTQIGLLYDLTFRYAVLGSGSATLRAIAGGQTFLLNAVADNNFDTTFKTFTTRFAGTGDSAIRIAFTSPSSTTNVDVGIDDVTVTAAVPEPATWAMMLVGFGGIGFAMRRRKSKVTTTVAYA